MIVKQENQPATTQTLRKILNLVFLSALLTSCATTQKKYEVPFEPQVLSSEIHYEENGKNYHLKSDIFIIDERTLRADVRTPLDLPLASFLMSERKLEYLLYRTKKYYSGRPGPKALDAVMPLDLTSSELIAVILERPLENQKCDTESGNLLRCRGTVNSSPYLVSYSRRDSTSPWSGKAKRMVIEFPQRKISLKFYFTEMEKNPSNLVKASTLIVPPDFQK